MGFFPGVKDGGTPGPSTDGDGPAGCRLQNRPRPRPVFQDSGWTTLDEAPRVWELEARALLCALLCSARLDWATVLG